MLDPLPMVRLGAVLLGRDERAALEALGELGLLHLIQGRAGPDTAPLEPPPVGPALSHWDRLLERAEGLRQTLGLAPVNAGERSQPEAPEQALQGLEARAGELLARREELLRRREEQSALGDRFRCYQGLDIPLDRIGTSPFLQLALGTLPEGGLEKLQERLGDQALLWAPPARDGRQPLVALGTPATLGRALEEAGFQAEALPRSGTLDACIEESHGETKRLADAEATLQAELQAFSQETARPLAGLEQRIQRERSLLDALGHCPRTGTTLLIQGWVPAIEAPLLERRLREATGGRCVLEMSPPERQEEDLVPVLLRPPALLRPFGKLVEGYGLPRYRELSPTPFVAISYLLMFGMMFGDVGHGALLALAGLAALRLGKWRDAGLLLLGGGLASGLFGVLYGSCFGLVSFKPFALWRDPLEGDPVQLMILATGFGVLMISLGLALNIINGLHRRDVLGACLGRSGLAGLLFYWVALAALLWRGAPPWLPLLLVLAVVAWVLKDSLEGESGSLADSVVEAFETVLLLLANTLSFVRLAAYAMSHAALMVAIVLAAEAAGPLAWLVLVAGNLAVILLEGVIASIQALRLEYYEFFSKFFSGAGRPFEPFRLGPKEGEA